MPSASQLESAAGFHRPHAVSWPRLIRAIVFGGAIAGTLDITDAFVTNALLAISPSPTRVLQSIASGLLGPAAYSGGAGTALLGLLCHFFIALSAAAVFVSVSQRLPVLQRRPVIAGIIFGLALHGVMQYVVLPLSFVRMSSTPTPPGQLVNQLLIHALGVGVPIALAARRWAPVDGTPSIP